MSAPIQPNPSTGPDAQFFGSRSFSKKCLPEAIMDTEVAVNVYGYGLLMPDGSIVVDRSGDDQPFTPEQIELLRDRLRCHLVYLFNAGFDLSMFAGMLAGFAPDRLAKLRDAIISKGADGRHSSPWRVCQSFGQRWPDIEHIDLQGCAPRDTGLKRIGMSLGSRRITELPFEPGSRLEGVKLDLVFGSYLRNDLQMTADFRRHGRTEAALAAREKVGQLYGLDVMSMSDPSLGEAVVVSQYGKATGASRFDMRDACHIVHQLPFCTRIPGFSMLDAPAALMAWRETINSGEFRTLDSGEAVPPQGVVTTLEVGGLMISLALGGMHSRDGPGVFSADDDYRLILADVTSYYPSLISKLGIRPRGLTDEFVKIVAGLLDTRVNAKRGGDSLTADSLKIPLNSIFGKLGSPYSALYDPAAKISVTLTGQYLLCALLHMISRIDGVRALSGNTDGITMLVRRDRFDELQACVRQWEAGCGMTLEMEDFAVYARDSVNEYVLVTESGKVKSKGKFFSDAADIGKVASNRVVAKAVVAALSKATPVRETVASEMSLDPFLMKVVRKDGAFVDGVGIGRLVRAYPSTDPDVPKIMSAPDKRGLRTQIFIGCRYVEELPDELPGDLDREPAIRAASEIVVRVSGTLRRENNEAARQLERAGFRIRPVRDGKLAETLSKVVGADYSMADVHLMLGKGALQALSTDVVERLGAQEDVLLWVIRDGARALAVVSWPEDRIVELVKATKRKTWAGGQVLTTKTVPVFADGVSFEIVRTCEAGVTRGVEEGGEGASLAEEGSRGELAALSTHSAQTHDSVDLSQVDNDTFLNETFGEWADELIVCSNTGAPDDQNHEQRPRWVGGPRRFSEKYRDRTRGNYLSISTFESRDDGSYSRRISEWQALHWVLIDDAGTKVAAPGMLGLPPATWVLETSPGNFQAGYALAMPETSFARAKALIDGLVAREGLTDPSAGDLNRYGRLVCGTNLKIKLGEPFQCRLVDWDPKRRYPIEDVAKWFGIDDLDVAASAVRTLSTGAGGGVANIDEALRHPAVQAFSGLGRVTDRPARLKEGWLWVDVVCPWSEEHTAGDTSGTGVGIGTNGRWAFRCHHGSHSARELVRTPDGREQLMLNRTAFHVRQWLTQQGIQVPHPTREEPGAAFAGMDGPTMVATAGAGVGHARRPLEVVDEMTGEVMQVDLGFFGVTAAGGKAGTAAAMVHPTPIIWADMPADPPDPKFVIPGWMPDKVVTLFAAHGGTGKSYMSLWIGLCLAIGRHPFEEGAAIRRCRVVLYSAEDGMEVMLSRLARYLRLMNIEPLDLDNWLLILDATECDNVLFDGEERIGGRTTSRFDWLRERVQQFGASVLIFDNASDAVDANENDRAKVRQFMSALKRLASAVLLLAHVDAVSSMSDPREAKGYSGSTGWHNSARSRWFMARQRDSDDILLTLPKSNYAKAGAEATIRWSDLDRVFRVVRTRSGRPTAFGSRDVLLTLLRRSVEVVGNNVSTSSKTSSSVYNVLKEMDGFPAGVTSREVAREVIRWREDGLVKVETYRRGNRTEGERLVLTDKGKGATDAAIMEAADA